MLQKIVLLDVDTLGDQIDLNPLMSLAKQVEVFGSTAEDQVDQRIQDADVVVTNKVVLDSACIKKAKRLKLICVAATGVNNVDVGAAHETGIVISNVVNYGAETVAQHTFALLLALTNRVSEYHARVKDLSWSQQSSFCLMTYPITELAEKTLLLCGYGAIGKSVERIAQAFGMKVLVAARKGEAASGTRTPFTQGLAVADVVSVHCPLTVDTQDLISSDEFAQMKSTALIINTARGGIVNENALFKALEQGEIAGAALDVLTEEPPRSTHPLVTNSIPNLIITPHCAWTATEARQRLFGQVISNIESFLKGIPSNQVIK